MSFTPHSSIPLFKMKVIEKGRIKDVKEVIVRVHGLPTCLNGQLVDLGGVNGIVMGFDSEEVLILALGDTSRLKIGQTVSAVSEPFKIPAGEACLGRVLTAFGLPADGGPPLETTEKVPVFRESFGITMRRPLKEFLSTGTKVIDMLTPIVKGQKQLILGDRMTGKTSIAIDAIINQKGKDVIGIFCCIGKSMASLEKVLGVLHKTGADKYTIVIAALDNSSVGEQYIVPFSAAAMGEYFAVKGKDVLVVFDDLTKHAWAYRQLSLLLERPPGREAYPGDIFYVQTQLMERACALNEKGGGGSITFFGIAETLQGDLTGYIPSNLASMCDGQIILSATNFAEGMRPAVDIALSISIVGGRAQPPLLKYLTRNIRSDYARYTELVKLSRISTGLSGESERMIRRGEVLKSIIQQPENKPVSIEESILLLYLYDTAVLLDFDKEEREQAIREIYPFAVNSYKEVIEKLANVREYDEIKNDLDKIVQDFIKERLKKN